MFAIGLFLVVFFFVVAGVFKEDVPDWIKYVGVSAIGIGFALMLASLCTLLWRVLP